MTELNVSYENETRDELARSIEQTSGRSSLEAMHDIFTDRLHRSSDDFDATVGLRLVIAKLQRASYGEPVVTQSS